MTENRAARGEERRRLEAATTPRGGETRRLTIGAWRLDLEGLDAPLARNLDRRWGAFLGASAGPSTLRVAVVSAGPEPWLAPPAPGEIYRLEPRGVGPRLAVVSYGFGFGPLDAAEGHWRVALSDDLPEPAERCLENALRLAVARLALDAGGFALHAAGVLEGGKAWLFAGASRSGKTTAVALCRPAVSLGDDFGLVVPEGNVWKAPAVPFDNAERIDHEPPRGLFPVGAVWRVMQAEQTCVESPSRLRAAASLASLVPFAWAAVDSEPPLPERAERFVTECRFGHLGFPLGADLRGLLFPGPPHPG